MSHSSDSDDRGPDFAAGIPEAAIPPEGVYGGFVGDVPVLLARVDGEITAIDGACSHYSGPLQRGLRVGNMINCPLHHACFDLRTGQALKAPALTPLNRWKVEHAGGTIYVRSKLGPAWPLPSDPTIAPKTIVIVGGGAAGFAAAQRLRELGHQGEITLLSADIDAPYDRPNVSKDYLAGQADPSWMPLKEASYYETNRIELRTGTRVEAIDTASRQITLQGDEILNYDALLLATGAEPNRLTAPGFDRANVHVLRTLADCEQLTAQVTGATKAVVIGSSFIGLEVAASLRTRGLAVEVVGSEELPLASKLGPSIGALVKSIHEEHGVRLHLGRHAVGFDGTRVTLDNGVTVAADLVVLGIGVKPRLELAQRAGLAIDRGVLVDAQMRSSDPVIFAAGDIARYPSPVGGPPIRVEHWVLAERQGQIAAEAMLGGKSVLKEPPYFWSVHYDLSIRFVGHAESWDRIEEIGSVAARDAEVRYFKGSRLVAVATINRDLASLEAAEALSEN